MLIIGAGQRYCLKPPDLFACIDRGGEGGMRAKPPEFYWTCLCA